MTDRQISELCMRLNLLPGHTARFKDMISRFKTSTHTRMQSDIPHRSSTPHHFREAHARRLGTLVTRPNFLEIDSTSDSDTELETLQKYSKEAKKQVSLLSSDTKPVLSKMHSLPSTDSSSSSLKILKQKSTIFEECRHNKNLDRDEVGSSYDSSKMRSTLAHLDIEEMCRCLSKAIIQHISQHLTYTPYIQNPIIRKLQEVFYDDYAGSIMPEELNVYNFMKNVLIRCRMEKEVSVISLVYIEKLVEKSGIQINAKNWKKVLLVAMILASKVWDDESFENKHFATVLTQFSLKEINEMESAFLSMLDFEVYVTQKDYASAYFTLRTYADSKCRSFPLQALDVESVRRLQSSCRKAEESLRQTYDNNLLKTL